jgi:hypothetical protein
MGVQLLVVGGVVRRPRAGARAFPRPSFAARDGFVLQPEFDFKFRYGPAADQIEQMTRRNSREFFAARSGTGAKSAGVPATAEA